VDSLIGIYNWYLFSNKKIVDQLPYLYCHNYFDTPTTVDTKTRDSKRIVYIYGNHAIGKNQLVIEIALCNQ